MKICCFLDNLIAISMYISNFEHVQIKMRTSSVFMQYNSLSILIQNAWYVCSMEEKSLLLMEMELIIVWEIFTFFNIIDNRCRLTAYWFLSHSIWKLEIVKWWKSPHACVKGVNIFFLFGVRFVWQEIYLFCGKCWR